MQWNGSPFSGFSTSRPWLPVHPDFPNRNIETQQNDPSSLLNWYHRLITIRREYPALQGGIFLPITYEPKNLLAYLRQTNSQSILVALNFSRKPVQLHLGGELLKKGWKLLTSSDITRTDAKIISGKVKLTGDEALLLIQEFGD